MVGNTVVIGYSDLNQRDWRQISVLPLEDLVATDVRSARYPLILSDQVTSTTKSASSSTLTLPTARTAAW